jgi:hypothetical protein
VDVAKFASSRQKVGAVSRDVALNSAQHGLADAASAGRENDSLDVLDDDVVAGVAAIDAGRRPKIFSNNSEVHQNCTADLAFSRSN